MPLSFPSLPEPQQCLESIFPLWLLPLPLHTLATESKEPRGPSQSFPNGWCCAPTGIKDSMRSVTLMLSARWVNWRERLKMNRKPAVQLSGLFLPQVRSIATSGLYCQRWSFNVSSEPLVVICQHSLLPGLLHCKGFATFVFKGKRCKP